MRNILKMRRGMAVFLLALLLTSFLFPLNAAANDKNGDNDFSKIEINYDIAMVFDNSLSMWLDDINTAGKYEYIPRWSRAKFAMEIFASMLNLEGGDTLTIFPMWKVVFDGSRPEVPADDLVKGNAKEGSAEYFEYYKKYQAGPNDRIDIKSQKDIDSISNMFTPVAAGTPFDPVDNALTYLKGLNENNGKRVKWLIILTDGEFGFYSNHDFDANTFSIDNEIRRIGADDVKIQYLSIDMKNNGQKPVGGQDFYVDNADGNGIQDKLIEICNRIFDRNPLPDDYINGKTITLDLAMRKVIVFVQGEGVHIKGMVDQNGKSVTMLPGSGQRRYSDFSLDTGNAGKIDKGRIATDTTLFGQVATFDACVSGTYTLDIDGSVSSDKIQVFYEPNVRVQTHLINKKTNEEIFDTENKDVPPGEYEVRCAIVDRTDPSKDVSESPLLGKDQIYTITVNNGDQTYEIQNGDTINLGEGESRINVEVTYLKKYTIRNSDSPFAFGFSVKPPEIDYKLVVKSNCQQEANYYEWKYADKWKPVRVDVSIRDKDGKDIKLTDEQMKALDIKIDPVFDADDPDIARKLVFDMKMLPGESAFELAPRLVPGKGDSGEELKKSLLEFSGEMESKITCKLNISCSMKEEYGRDVTGTDSSTLTFSKYSKWFFLILFLIIFACLIALILWFMSRKVLPKDVKATQQIFKTSEAMMEGQGKASLERKAKKIKVASPPADEAMNCRISFEVVPVSRRWTRSKDRAYQIVRIFGGASTVDKIEINAIGYVKSDKGGFVSEDNPDMPLKINPRSTYNVTIFAEEAQLECKIVNK